MKRGRDTGLFLECTSPGEPTFFEGECIPNVRDYQELFANFEDDEYPHAWRGAVICFVVGFGLLVRGRRGDKNKTSTDKKKKKTRPTYSAQKIVEKKTIAGHVMHVQAFQSGTRPARRPPDVCGDRSGNCAFQ